MPYSGGSASQPLNSALTQIAAMGDPGADRIAFWDESSNNWVWLTAGTNLTITDTTIAAVGGTDGWYIPIDLYQVWKAQTGTWAAALSPSGTGTAEAIGNAWFFNSSNAQNDALTLDLYIPAGTWVVGLVTPQSANRAIYSFQLDSTERWTYDAYAAGDTFNNIVETGTYVVPATAKYEFKMKAANRNASASGWYLSPSKLYLRRTA